MKKIIVVLSTLLFSLFSFSRSISSDEALSYACEVLGTSPVNLSVVWTGTDPGSEPALYAINSSRGGFAVISGVDCINPVLGYSFEGEFKSDGMPQSVRDYFAGFENDLRQAESSGVEVPQKKRGLWNVVESSTKASYPAEIELTTATWDQEEPYNSDCTFAGHSCLTGCVATAMAIVFRYYEYPERPCGTLPAYSTWSHHYSVPAMNLDDDVFEWSKMPLKDSDVRSGSSEQKKAIARLMRICGSMVEMDYTKSGSSAFMYAIASPAVKNMLYDASSINYAQKGLYSSAVWNDMMKSEISSGHPLIYAGADLNKEAGHAFVVDGYDKNGYYHVNWGWGGTDNGYFSLNLSIGQYSFCEDQQAIFGLRKGSGTQGTIREQLFMYGDGMSLRKGKLARGEAFDCTISVITNLALSDYSGSLRLALVDRNGEVKASSEEASFDIPAATASGDQTYTTFNFHNVKLDVDMAFSDRLVLQYKSFASGEYVTMPYYRSDEMRGYLVPIKYNFIETAASYKVGDQFDLSLIVGEQFDKVEWFFNGEKASSSSICLTRPGTYTVKAVLTFKSGTETLVQEIIVK